MLWLIEDLHYICKVFNVDMNLVNSKYTLTVKKKIKKNKIKFNELNNLFLTLKDKDFSIIIDTGNEVENCYIKFTNLDQNNDKNFIKDLKNISENEFDIEIRFDKSKYNRERIYIYGRLDSFINELNDNWMNNEMFKFDFKDTNKATILIIEEENIFVESDFFIICTCDKYVKKEISKEVINDEFKLISMSKENCNWINIQHKYSPKVFNFQISNNEKINSVFRRINTILILMYISNYVELKEMKILCIVNSIKRVVIKLPQLNVLEVTKEEYDWLFKCFNLIYDEYNADKFSILRNVIGSLIVCRNQGEKYRIILENSKWIYESTNDNWEMFLSSNIDKYFEKKYKFVEEIKNKTQELHKKASNIVKDIYKNAISIILLVIGSIVGKNYKVIKWSSIIGIVYLIIYGIAYIPLMFIESNDINEEFKNLTKKYEKEFNPNKEELHNDRQRFNKKKKILTIYRWGYIINYSFIILILIYCICNSKNVSKIINIK